MTSMGECVCVCLRCILVTAPSGLRQRGTEDKEALLVVHNRILHHDGGLCTDRRIVASVDHCYHVFFAPES